VATTRQRTTRQPKTRTLHAVVLADHYSWLESQRLPLESLSSALRRVLDDAATRADSSNESTRG